MRIDWIAPNSGSLEIEGYLVEIMTNDDTTYEQTSSCDGFDDYIKENMFCVVPIATLTAEPFSLDQGKLIRVRISAKNSLGYGIASTLNTVGVLAQV